MKRSLTREDYLKAAGVLGCEPAAIATVARVEAGRHGAFYPDGFPMILFERHKFYKHVHKSVRAQVTADHPDLCYPKPYAKGGYGTVADQRVRFSRAFRIDAHAAMMACSWGLFQELGENYDDYGFESVDAFVDAMKSGVDAHLGIFIKSVRKRGLVDELQRHDWENFARLYNGPAYKKNDYPAKMAAAYKAAVAEFRIPVKFSEISDSEIEEAVAVAGDAEQVPEAAPVSDVQAPDSSAPDAARPDQTSDPAPEPEVLNVEDWKDFVFRWLKRVWGTVSGANVAQGSTFFYAAANDPGNWWIYGLVAVVLLILLVGGGAIVSAVLLLIWHRNRAEIERYITMAKLAVIDPGRRDLKLNFEKK